MLRFTLLPLIALLTLSPLSLAADAPPAPWLGVHLSLRGDAQARELAGQFPRLAQLGVNVLVVEINYGFQYTSHPELADRGGLSRDGARQLAAAAKAHRIRLVPQINCLGHQSWSSNTAILLRKHPEFDETPNQFPENKGIYCRSWCPQHPDVNKIIFDLMDELIDAFQADAFHVGMDEVFLIASPHCTRCAGKDPAQLFAKAVNDYHQHLVKTRKVEMLMWADRLLDAKATGYGKWEAADNGTARAIDLIPKDIILCDWHYTKRPAYPSVPLFIEKGFRVWPSGWDNVAATEAFIASARQHRSPLLLGHLCTTWGKAKTATLADFPPIQAAAKLWRDEK